MPRSNSDLYYLFELVMIAGKFMKALEYIYIYKKMIISVFFLQSRLRDCSCINHCKAILSTWQKALEIFDIFYEHNAFISHRSAYTWLTRLSISVSRNFVVMLLIVDLIYRFSSLGNVFLLLPLLFLLHYLMVLYEFRNMPPGPRFTALPVLGNIFSLKFRADKLSDRFRRLV